uniref:Uncharacterized protein n=1 Tax=Aegilops tauschii subsp. strangulata TaxID=200361 RepID=A0A453JTU3_AEGTS
FFFKYSNNCLTVARPAGLHRHRRVREQTDCRLPRARGFSLIEATHSGAAAPKPKGAHHSGAGLSEAVPALAGGGGRALKESSGLDLACSDL